MYGNKSHSKHYRVGGTRGGQDHFKWDEVKNDKYRENYLGNSLHAPVGRWQKGKDLTWYAKSKSEQDASLEEERRRLRALDEDLMNEALGIRAQKKWNERETLDNDEIRRLLTKGETALAAEGEVEVVDRAKGLGVAPAKFHEHIDRKSRLAEEIERLKKQSTEGNDASSTIKARVIDLSASIGNNSEPKKRSWEEIAAPGAKLPPSQTTDHSLSGMTKEENQRQQHHHYRSRSCSRDRRRHDSDKHASRYERDSYKDRNKDREKDRYRDEDKAEKRRKRSRSSSLSRSDDEEKRRHRHHKKEKKHHKDKKQHRDSYERY